MKTYKTVTLLSLAAHKANWTRKAAKLERELYSVSAQRDAALIACQSIRFANTNSIRHGGEYSLNDLLAADRLAMEALRMGPAMTKEFVDHAARGLLKKYRAQHDAKKGGAS
jgi:hypothetical protein